MTVSGPSAASAAGFATLGANVRRLADEVLWPASAEVDRASSIPAGHHRAIADLGLYGMTAPVSAGGLGLDGAQVRSVLRILASGCGATTFAFAQHLGTVAALSSAADRELRDRWLPSLVADTLSGTAYAHLRGSGPPALRARRTGAGWTFSGRAPWVSSWGTAEVLSVAARSVGPDSPEDEIVWALIPAREGSGLSVEQVFDLAVYGATRTAALALDRVEVTGSVLHVYPASEWLDRDRALAARPNPCCLGVGDRALALLAARDRRTASVHEGFWLDVAARAEEASAAVDRGEARPEDVAQVRAEVLVAVQRLTSALLAVEGGRAMVAGHPAQRLSREAAFYIIQAQSPVGRGKFLERVAPTTT